MGKIITSLFIGLIAQSSLYGQDGGRVTIDSSNEILVVSRVKDTFYIQVSLPLDYGQTNKKYPIIYVLDADRTFGLTTDISRWLTFGEEVPSTIIVGIAYKNNWWQKRSRDYTPTKDKIMNWGDWPLAGGADIFMSTIKNEINASLSKYKIDWSNRTIIGLSFGGLFVNYVLFKSPDMFDNYLMVSPALIWNDKYLFSLNREALKSRKSIIKAFTAIGTLDEEKIIIPWRQMNYLIVSEKYEKVSWTFKEYDNQTHLSVLPIAITDGLKKLFENGK
jgi:uncharacterized protein